MSAAATEIRPLPLTGVRVLDLGHVFQGPYAAFLMAMAGADVIKVEPPHGDMSRKRGRDGDYPFRALNGCKRGVVINLKKPRGRELLLELSKSADVLIENFAPAVMISALLQHHHVPSAPLRNVMEVLHDPHLIARGFLTEQATEAGPVALPNSPMRYEGSPLRAPPGLGADTDAVLAELCGISANELASLHAEGVL